MSTSGSNGFSMHWPGEPDRLEESAGPQRSGLAVTLQSADLIDVVAERAGFDIDPMLDHLDRELVGLIPVKTRVHQITDFLLVDRLRYRYGLMPPRPTLHMCFTGGPGTGKSTVALRMAEILKRLGHLERGHLVRVTRNELVGNSVGHTATTTKAAVKQARGGVIFIDETSSLYRAPNERDDGAAAIEVLLQAMEYQREELVVILAGDKDQMECFFQSNPGMSSHIAHHIDFPDYSVGELCAIAERMLADQRYAFSSEGREAFRHDLERRIHQPGFANARSVRNALERARFRQANRIISHGDNRCSRQDLVLIEPDDIVASCVIEGDGPDLLQGATADDRRGANHQCA